MNGYQTHAAEQTAWCSACVNQRRVLNDITQLVYGSRGIHRVITKAAARG
jgi:hypothetical protein